MRRLVVLASGSILFGVLQHTSSLRFFGVKPNLFFVAAYAIAFFSDSFTMALSLLLLLGVFIRFGGIPPEGIILFLVLALGAYFLRRILPGRSFVNYLLFLFITPFIFYAVVDWSFLTAGFETAGTILLESVYTIGVGAVVYRGMMRLCPV